MSGEKGQSARLSCSVDSNPSPEYTWFKNSDLKTVKDGLNVSTAINEEERERERETLELAIRRKNKLSPPS